MTGLPDDRPTAVYRFFDASDRLLYVGITYDTVARWKGHAKKPWWPDAVRRETVWFPTRTEAMIEESRAIRFENPVHNDREGASSIGWRTIRPPQRGHCDAYYCAPSDHLDLRRLPWFRRIDHIRRHRAHTLMALDGVTKGVMVPLDWYEEACAALGETFDLASLPSVEVD